MKDIKFLESVPCSSLNKMLKNFGTCFDMQKGWQSFSWQNVCIFDNQLLRSLHAEECEHLGAVCLVGKKKG